MKESVLTTAWMTRGGGGDAGGEKKSINPELWQACAGPLVNLPAAETHVVYFPQGHSEQVCHCLFLFCAIAVYFLNLHLLLLLRFLLLVIIFSYASVHQELLSGL